MSLSGSFAAAVLEAGGPLVGTVFGPQILDDDLRTTFGLDGVTDIGAPGAVNVETIAALAPDLIIAELRRGAVEGLEDLNLLRAVAPVYVIELFQPVEAISARFAEAIGGDAAERLAAVRGPTPAGPGPT